MNKFGIYLCFFHENNQKCKSNSKGQRCYNSKGSWYKSFHLIILKFPTPQGMLVTSEIPWDGCWVDCNSDQAFSQKSWTSLSTGVGFGRAALCSRLVWDQTSCKVSFHFLYIFARCSIHQLVFVFLALPWHLIPVSLGFTISRVQDNFQRFSILNVILYLFTLFPELIPVTSSQSQYDVLSSSLDSHVM